MSLLSVQNISAFYGPSQALFDVSLSLNEGEVLALMGRNGMGKSTTVKSICRMLNAGRRDDNFQRSEFTLNCPATKRPTLGSGWSRRGGAVSPI